MQMTLELNLGPSQQLHSLSSLRHTSYPAVLKQLWEKSFSKADEKTHYTNQYRFFFLDLAIAALDNFP